MICIFKTMKIIKVFITIIIMIVYIVPFCHGQNTQYSYKLRPKVKAKLDSLYPHATSDIVLYDKYVSDTTQEIRINCHCDETKGMIKLVFDTNGNLLNKEIHFTTINGLPDTIVNYMKRNTSKNCIFPKDYMIKIINNKGEISYGIILQEFATEYLLWFKGSGEFMYREALQGDPW
jgi:hypothetical protein